MKFIKLAMTLLFLMFIQVSPTIAGGNLYKGRTIVYYASKYGVQVEYFSSSGKTYLWFPGKRRVFKGRWKTNKLNRVCVRYRTDWLCQRSTGYTSAAKYTCRGDVFRLSSGKIPYLLKRHKSGLGKLKTKCGGRT